MAENAGEIPRRIAELSSLAKRDRRDIFDYTEEWWGSAQADIFDEFLEHAIEDLAARPAIAPFAPNAEGLRVYLLRWKNARQGYRILFDETESGIMVLRILHTSRNW